ncbi:MAG: PAS domain-containing protein [Candidatus Obscuribacterales bacterium]|nr:PAS domain-containing protein [Candidatus Obscuribacterales bacterium]
MNYGPLFRTLFDSSADGFLVSDRNGRILDCNPSMAKLIGCSASEIAKRQLGEVIDVGSGKDVDTPSTVFLNNGLSVLVPATHLAIEEGADAGVFLTVVYIVQASSVQQAQTEFVSTVSHELRTPLTSIKGFADTILRAGDRLDASQQRRYIGIIKDQADRLTRLVEDLLAVSRLESRKMQLTIRALNFEEAVQRVCQNLTDKTVGHQLAIKVPPGLPAVWADADRLEQILTNLIDNAIKYSPANTTVTISARSVNQDQEMVEFSVTDEGGGIAPEHLPQIFSKFSRLDNPLTRQTEGTGLGLYITKSLVVALDGNINVSSNPGSTTFTVQIPAATLEQQAARGRSAL